MGGSRGGTGDPDPSSPPLKNHKNLEFLSNTGLDPLKNHKATKPEFNVWPFEWCFAVGQIMAHLKWYLDHLSSQLQKRQNWIPSDKTFWIHA